MEPELGAEAADTAPPPCLPAQGRQPRHPSTLHMVIEALQAQDKRKGASVVAIKRFILAKYPTVDPSRLGYLLKQALSKGLSRGDLVRPHNSSAMGATGRFKLAPEKLRQKQPVDQVDPNRGQAPKPGQKGTAELPAGHAGQRGAVGGSLAAATAKLRTRPVDAPPPAAAKPRSDGAKPPRAARQPRAPGKGRSGSPVAPAAEGAGGGGGGSPGGAGAKGSRAAPVGKSRAKVPRGAQQDPPKAKGGQGKARKPRGTPEAGQGQARLRKAAAPPEDRQGP